MEEGPGSPMTGHAIERLTAAVSAHMKLGGIEKNFTVLMLLK